MNKFLAKGVIALIAATLCATPYAAEPKSATSTAQAQKDKPTKAGKAKAKGKKKKAGKKAAKKA